MYVFLIWFVMIFIKINMNKYFLHRFLALFINLKEKFLTYTIIRANTIFWNSKMKSDKFADNFVFSFGRSDSCENTFWKNMAFIYMQIQKFLAKSFFICKEAYLSYWCEHFWHLQKWQLDLHRCPFFSFFFKLFSVKPL